MQDEALATTRDILSFLRIIRPALEVALPSEHVQLDLSRADPLRMAGPGAKTVLWKANERNDAEARATTQKWSPYSFTL